MSKNKKGNRDLIRMAALFQKCLAESQTSTELVLPETEWLACQRLARLYEKAVSRNWLSAAARTRSRFQRALREFQAALTQTLSGQAQQKPLSLRELSTELWGLFDEFPGAECHLRRKTISVMTEPVVLEEVYLGAFRIELDLRSEGMPLAYSVVAMEPHPAAHDEEVTHPHIRSEDLCEGEGTVPIRRALDAGRLGDFFQIVSQILHTYNPDSAYVALNEWEGLSCTACGMSVVADERTNCWASSDPVCYECVVTCPDCDHDFAPALTERCSECEEDYCESCLDQGMCHACQEKAPQEKPETDQSDAETSSGRCSGWFADVDQTEPLETALR